jgi:hypothetical protein
LTPMAILRRGAGMDPGGRSAGAEGCHLQGRPCLLPHSSQPGLAEDAGRLAAHNERQPFLGHRTVIAENGQIAGVVPVPALIARPGPTSRTLEWLFWNTGLLIARVRYGHISGSGQQPRRNCPAARHNLRSGPAHWLTCRLQDCGGTRAAELPSRSQGSGESPAIRARSVPWLHSWLHGLVVVWMFLWPRSRVK